MEGREKDWRLSQSTVVPFIQANNNRALRSLANDALKLFDKDAEFEIVQVLPYVRELLGHPEHDDLFWWSHLSFTAKPKNASDCITDVSPKHFFAEFLVDSGSSWKAKHCFTFEPSDDIGFEHGCLICPADQKFHPSASGCTVARPPYYKVAITWT